VPNDQQENTITRKIYTFDGTLVHTLLEEDHIQLVQTENKCIYEDQMNV